MLAPLAETPAPPPAGGSQVFIIGAGLVALGLSLVVWPIVRFVISLAHEGSHAITGSLMGATIEKIEVYRARPNQPRAATFYAKQAGPLGRFFTVLAGYLGPSAFGLAGAWLLASGHPAAVLWLSVVFLFVALLNAGNLLARVAIIIAGVVFFVVIRYASAAQQAFFAYVWIWFLLIGGFGHVLVLQRERRDGDDQGSDAYRLRGMTFLPASLWSGFFWLATLVALGYGAAILVGAVHFRK